VIAYTAIFAHFSALLLLMLASVPKGYDSFYEAHGSLSAIAAGIAYLILFMSDKIELRRFALGTVVGAWIAFIAPDLEHRLAGAIGLALFALGVWSTEVSRQLDTSDKHYY
jgi:hypothetical protein